jgi:acyl-coenzyme A synthetase/AMP-(fatty) acid ligase
MPDGFNFTAHVVDRLARERPGGEALRAIDAKGRRASLSFAEVAEQAAYTAAGLAAAGIRKGDVVMTLMGARVEWVLAMLGAWRLGAAVLPASEQLRSKDFALRIDRADVDLVLTAERNRDELERALRLAENAPAVCDVDGESLPAGTPGDAAATTADDPALIVFTSGTTGEPKGAVHTQGYLRGQQVQAEHWYNAHRGELAWCTAASGWSLSARNAFVAPWLTGATALLHDARFDPEQRCSVIASENVAVLCQAPTEYRLIAKHTSLDDFSAPALRRMVSAGEPLNPEIMGEFKQATGLDIYDGYGQTETGPLAAMPIGEPVRTGSMGKPLPGYRTQLQGDDDGSPSERGELWIDPNTVPTFFRGYLGESPHPRGEWWRTGDRVRRDADGFLWFDGRIDDVIISAGYRIGPFEVESALVEHPAVAEAAAVAAPDSERGSLVRAVVVLRNGYQPAEVLARELQEHVKSTTAPYKYPRIVEFRDSLPKTSSGKIKRAELRGECA